MPSVLAGFTIELVVEACVETHGRNVSNGWPSYGLRVWSHLGTEVLCQSTMESLLEV